jgi:hypothetical protein
MHEAQHQSIIIIEDTTGEINALYGNPPPRKKKHAHIFPLNLHWTEL